MERGGGGEQGREMGREGGRWEGRIRVCVWGGGRGVLLHRNCQVSAQTRYQLTGERMRER